MAGALPARDSLAIRAERLARPLARGERIDVDAAPAEELVRLPRIGTGLAGRIVADREARGPFGSLEGLARVAGIGPATLEQLRPHVRFSRRAAAPRDAGRVERVPVNRADAAVLETLPGIGPALARAIILERERNGPFRRIEELARVRGIGPATVKRLEGRITVP